MVSLKEKCFEVILENFDRYHLAYYKLSLSSPTEYLSEKRKFEFLQRKYSYEIAVQLYEKSRLRVEYIDFLINKFLKNLDTDWLKQCSWETIDRKFAEIGHSLEHVHFAYFDNPWVKVICYLPNLQSVNIFKWNEMYLKNIAKFCPKIKQISCTSSGFNAGLKYLCKLENGNYPCPELTEINLDDSYDTTDEDIAYLVQNLPSLQKIDYHKLPQVLHSIHKNDIYALDKIKPYNLAFLQFKCFNSNIYDDVLKICTTVCPHLKWFACWIGKKEHMDLCSQLSELQILHLRHFNPHCCFEINDFFKVKRNMLTTLYLEGFSILLPDLIRNCPNLNYLSLNGVTFQCSESNTLPVFHSLKVLRLRHDPDDINMFISVTPNLEELSFRFGTLLSTDMQSGILKYCEQTTLWNLDLTYSSVTTKFVQYVLLACSSLKTLNLKYCRLYNDYDEETKHLKFITNFREEKEKLKHIAANLPNRPLILF